MGINFIDQYSFLHFSVGAIIYFFNISFMKWNMLHILFEYFENTEYGIEIINKYFFFWPGGKYGPDTLINNYGDIIFGALGWLVSYLIDYYGNKYNLYPRHLIYTSLV